MDYTEIVEAGFQDELEKIAKAYVDSDGKKHIGGAGLTVPGAILAGLGGVSAHSFSKKQMAKARKELSGFGDIRHGNSIAPKRDILKILNKIEKPGRIGGKAALGLGLGMLGGGITMSALKSRAKKRDA